MIPLWTGYQPNGLPTMNVKNRWHNALFTSLILLISMGLGCGSLLDSGYGPKVENGPIEVFYTDGATMEEATKVAAILSKETAEGSGKKSIQLKKPNGLYQLRVVIQTGLQNDPRTHVSMQILGTRVSHEALNQADIEIHICDERFKTLSTFPLRPDLRYVVQNKNVEVFYPQPELETDAHHLAEYLQPILGKPENSKASFKIVKRDTTYEVHIVLASGKWNEPDYVQLMKEAGQELGQKVFGGAPTEMHLCDDVFTVHKVVK